MNVSTYLFPKMFPIIKIASPEVGKKVRPDQVIEDYFARMVVMA